MGRPLIISIDSLITYPIVEKSVFIFENIHPIWITLVGFLFKYLSILYITTPLNYTYLMVCLLIERYIDCLDGEVARTFKKCTYIGHYLDKISDVIFRMFMIIRCLGIVYYNPITIYTMILLSFTFLCPSLYIADWYTGKMDHQLISNKNSYSILLEDNATIICILLPYLLYNC